jgi:mRNA interferase RelE/StbE
MTELVDLLPDTPQTQALADVANALGRSAGDVHATHQPTREVVPDWLVDRLVHTAGMARAEVEAMRPEVAMQTWEAFITRPGE